MIPKSGYRFSEEIMLKLKIKDGSEFSEAESEPTGVDE
jgi:hypothetical protein